MSEFTSALIGLGGAVIGALIGGVFSFRGSKASAKDNIDAQNKIINENKDEEKRKAIELKSVYAKIIFLDFITAIMESVNVVKGVERKTVGRAPNLIPMNTEYSKAIAALSDSFTATELREINKLYGIIEKIRNDILKIDYVYNNFDGVKFDCKLLLIEVFGNKHDFIMGYEANMITDDFVLIEIPNPYKSIFEKLKGMGNII